MTSKKLYSLFFGCLCLQSYLYGKNQQEVEYTPIYAGTLLAFFPENIPPGMLAIQPYQFFTWESSNYDDHWKKQKQSTVKELTTLLLLETGITNFLDVTLLTSGSYTHVNNLHTFSYGDTKVYLGFQILRDQKGSWRPDLRFLLGESFPTGKYDNLNPNKILSDSSGTGSYQTSFILVTRKIFYYFPKHPFNFNLNLVYTLSNDVNVNNYNVYGGVQGTRGKVFPGNNYLVNLAFEYSITRNWVLGMDMRYQHQNKASFTKIKGNPTSIDNASFGTPSSEQISLAPCLEYNFNEKFGLLVGSWFTIAGRNSNQFVNATVSVYYEF